MDTRHSLKKLGLGTLWLLIGIGIFIISQILFSPSIMYHANVTGIDRIRLVIGDWIFYILAIAIATVFCFAGMNSYKKTGLRIRNLIGSSILKLVFVNFIVFICAVMFYFIIKADFLEKLIKAFGILLIAFAFGYGNYHFYLLCEKDKDYVQEDSVALMTGFVVHLFLILISGIFVWNIIFNFKSMF